MTTHAVPTGAVAVASERVARPVAAEADLVTTVAGRRALAVLRLATGFVFLWAFLDKTFGLGFSTAPEAAWINGGTPAQGFLTHAVTGPLQGFFAGLANPFVDFMFMVGLFGIGAALMLGIGLRVAAGATVAMMLLMYLAEWPFAANAGSTNPLVDYHIVYALVAVAIAFLSAGDTWGLGAQWKKLPFVQKAHWLI